MGAGDEGAPWSDRRRGAGDWLWRVVSSRELRRLLLAVLVAVATTGVMFGSSGADETGPPAIEDVPGADDRANGVSVEAVERELLAGINDARASEGLPRLTTASRLAAAATYRTQRRMVLRYGEATPPQSGDDVGCSRTLTAVARTIRSPTDGPGPFGEGSTASEVATLLLYELSDAQRLWSSLTAPTVYAAGVDVHVAPDGSVAVRILLC